MKALIFGGNPVLMEALPALLTRAGFAVHVIATSMKMKKCRDAAKFIHAASPSELIALVAEQSEEGYDLIVVSDDYTQNNILHSGLALEKKVALLPVLGPENFEHLSSKIGLSKALRQHHIDTPDFLTANNIDELTDAVRILGFPLLIKPDLSSGGAGIHECLSDRHLDSTKDKISYPVLVQKKIEGKVVDLSGFFQAGKLIYFGYSEFVTTSPENSGPSTLRKYRKTSSVKAEVVHQLNRLGNALGLDGFANITCIEATSDGKLYFFEADTRPNVWVEHQKYFEEDPAIKIKDYFGQGITFKPIGDQKENLGDNYFFLPYLPRMKVIDIVTNRYNCKGFYENYLYRNVLMERSKQIFTASIIKSIKPFIQKKLWDSVKRKRNILSL